MSDPIFPLPPVAEGTTQIDIEVNDSWLRIELLSREAEGVANSPSVSTQGTVYIVGSAPTGEFSTFSEDDAVISDGLTWHAYTPYQDMRLVVAGVRKVYDSGAWIDDPSVSGGGGGTGDVVGPASSVNNRIAAFDGTTGKLLKDGGKTIAELRAPSIQSVTSSATVTPTFSDDMVKVTAQAAALALANPTGTAIPGLGMVIRIKDNGTARAISYGSQYRAIGVTLPTTTVVNKTLYLAMIYNSDDTKWDVLAVGQEA